MIITTISGHFYELIPDGVYYNFRCIYSSKNTDTDFLNFKKCYLPRLPEIEKKLTIHFLADNDEIFRTITTSKIISILNNKEGT